MKDDSDVAVSRWLCRAEPDARGWVASEVGVFAGAHGSCPATVTMMGAAVSEALVELFDAESASHAGTVVDAATDGLWLSVRLQGPGCWPATAVQARLTGLAHRVEMGFDGGGASMTALFEFPSDAGGGCERTRGDGPLLSTDARTREGSPRCTARRRPAARRQSARRRRPAE